MPFRFSPTGLSLLKDCPRCFWLDFKKGIKRPQGIFPSLPSGMDRILKVHFDRFMAEGKLPPELEKALNGSAGEYKLFSDAKTLEVWRSNFKGIQYTDPDGNVLRGAVDNILEKDGKLVVLDYKTRGFPLKVDTHVHYQDQMDFYNFLLRKNGWKTENYSFLLFYHPNQVKPNGEITFHTNLIRVPVHAQNPQKILTHALTVLNGRMPAPTKECKWCAYREKRAS